MKAIILAAGFGTRLLPYTEIIPKPLFPIGGRPLLAMMISELLKAGCQELIINTHHLSQKVEAFISAQQYSFPVTTRYEPVILGTGGAIKNVADFWNHQPFMAVNSDIITDIPLKEVYHYHLKHEHPVTLVLSDDKEFNTVTVDKNGFILSLSDKELPPSNINRLTFTGIQVLDPRILDFIPARTYASITDIYKKLMASGEKIKAFITKNYYWKDIGTPERYKQVVFEKMAPIAFQRAFTRYKKKNIRRFLLAGDGSDRIWYRLISGNYSLIMADHGIKTQSSVSEIDSYIAIGQYLDHMGIPVPKIYHYDSFAGPVFMEDLGDMNFQSYVCRIRNLDDFISAYHAVINLLVQIFVKVGAHFEPCWAYQTPVYSKEFIVEKECRYFVEAFLNGFIGLKIRFETLEDECKVLAEQVVELGTAGFMHRDFQSRNIMVKDNNYYVIDFQGGRIGPIQYDLASLLTDPYVEVPPPMQSKLVEYCADRLSEFIRFDKNVFYRGYEYCSLSRNLQILGAFGFLSRVKGKKMFENYIPAAVKSLKDNLQQYAANEFPRLTSIVKKL